MRFVKLIAALLVAGSQLQAATHELNPELFDGIASRNESNVRLHGLAALYPGRVLFEEPKLTANEERSEAARIEKLRDTIRYIRVYQLDDAIDIIQEHLHAPSLILDLRYTQSATLARDLSLKLDQGNSYRELVGRGNIPDDEGTLLGVDFEASEPVRDSAIVVLCNHATAGPFEALLHNLQARGAIIAVGQATSGRTGYYHQVEGPAWLLNGEIRPNVDTSLVGVGFVPRITVDLTAKEHYTAYHWYEAGSSLEQTLSISEPENSEAELQQAIDPVLERGVEIVAALQILQ